jgi:hypothetical protein
VANVIKENEKTLVFNGLDEGEILVMQPLINVLEGTLVEMLGNDQGRTAGRRELNRDSLNNPKICGNEETS